MRIYFSPEIYYQFLLLYNVTLHAPIAQWCLHNPRRFFQSSNSLHSPRRFCQFSNRSIQVVTYRVISFFMQLSSNLSNHRHSIFFCIRHFSEAYKKSAPASYTILKKTSFYWIALRLVCQNEVEPLSKEIFY